MLADEDPLLISQSLTYVTDDGSTLHSFHSAPFSIGTCAFCVRFIRIPKNVFPSTAVRSSRMRIWNVQNPSASKAPVFFLFSVFLTQPASLPRSTLYY